MRWPNLSPNSMLTVLSFKDEMGRAMKILVLTMIAMLTALVMALSMAVRSDAQTATVLQAAAPGDADLDRITVDTRVSDVRVSDDFTMAVLNMTSVSPCASNNYFYPRLEPKWLFETGRLLQAMREQALVRISFSCLEGFQYINALQFLEPLVDPVELTTPTRGEPLRTTALTANTPTPGDAALRRATALPLPGAQSPSGVRVPTSATRPTRRSPTRQSAGAGPSIVPSPDTIPQPTQGGAFSGATPQTQ